MPDADSDPRAHAAVADVVRAASQSAGSPPPLSTVLARAGWRALGGGAAGAAAMAVSVVTLMPLRTLVNVQLRRGGGLVAQARALLAAGGVPRLYAGLGAALLMAPASRFCDLASNAGALALLGSLESTRSLPLAVQTVAASLTAAACRVALAPLDAAKTVRQVDGAAGAVALRARLAASGPRALFAGGGAMAANTLVAHYTFFAAYNTLRARFSGDDAALALLPRTARNAAIGFACSIFSDTASNAVRVVKTVRQTTGMPYGAAIASVVQVDGAAGLLLRGLRTRIVTNGIQGVVFGILWRALDDLWLQHEGNGKTQRE